MTLDEHPPGSAELADGTAVLGLKAAPSRVSKEKDAFAGQVEGDTAAPGGSEDALQSSAPKTVPVVLIRAIDMYAAEPKAPTMAGGVVTLLAVLGALAYSIYQFADYSHAPPTTTSFVEWSDAHGPFPARIRCTARTGCWVSNRHNDRWSSNGDLVEAKQQGCMYLHFGEEYVMNITFTQNTDNGFTIVWDPNEWEEGTTPGSGLQIMSDMNIPAAPSGISVLATPALGGVYLANFVQTTNNSAPEAKLRREWFITYVSSEKRVIPETTACAANLTDYMLANYTQASLRLPSQWYRVTVDPPNLLMTLIGNCGGLPGLGELLRRLSRKVARHPTVVAQRISPRFISTRQLVSTSQLWELHMRPLKNFAPDMVRTFWNFRMWTGLNWSTALPRVKPISGLPLVSKQVRTARPTRGRDRALAAAVPPAAA